jgi:Flp pilus assembly protein TadB
MNRFTGARDAKEFLVSRIAAEAEREGVPLSEVERKMLYFSETAWTLPNMMAISDQFERRYDQDEYEDKIARLIRTARQRARREDRPDFEAWSDAIRALSKEDHYILLMVKQAGGSVSVPGQLFRFWRAGVALVCVYLLLPFFFPGTDWLFLFLWVVTAGVAGVYVLCWTFLGLRRTNALAERLAGKLRSPLGLTK